MGIYCGADFATRGSSSFEKSCGGEGGGSVGSGIGGLEMADGRSSCS